MRNQPLSFTVFHTAEFTDTGTLIGCRGAKAEEVGAGKLIASKRRKRCEAAKMGQH